MAKKVAVSINLQGNYLAVIKKAQRYTSAFDKDVKKMTADLDKARKKKIDLAIKDSKARKVLSSLEKKLAPMRNVMVKVAANVAHFKNQIKPVTDTIKKVTSKVWTVSVRIKDGVSSILGKIGQGLKTIGKGVAISAAAIIGAGGYALNKGMKLQGYGISMEHFVGVNNPNASKDQIKAQTDAYMNFLRKNANETPFGTEEVIQAGARAVGITNGNTDAAQGLVKMAENMAALIPDKTVMDAMEALADASMGEFERMKEFNFKISAAEFKKAGYDLFSTKSNSGLTLEQMFGGGADAFANTPAGILSTITGEIESEVAEIGLEMLKGLQPLLEWVRDDVLPDLKQWLKPIKEGGQNGMKVLTDGIQKAYYFLKDQVPAAISAIQKAWESLSAALTNENNPIVALLKRFGIDLPAIFAPKPSGNDGKDSGKTGTTKPQYGEPPAPLSKDSIFFDAAKQTAQNALGPAIDINKVWDITKGTGSTFALFKAVQLLTSSKTLPAKILSTGVDLASTGVEAAGTAIGTASPTLGVALANLTSTLGAVLPGLPVMVDWAQNQVRNSDAAFGEKYGRAPNWYESILYTGQHFNDVMTQRNKEYGDTVNTTMDNLFGIIRQPNGVFPDMGATWANWMKGNTGNVSVGWMGGPTPGQEDYTMGYGGLGGDFNVADRLAALQTTNVDAAATAIQNTNTAATGASDALNTFIGWLNKVKSAGGGGYWTPEKEAAGIKRVPSDNYPALLHKGETVLPAGEAGEYRRNGNASGQSSKVFNLNITVNGAGMDENRLASLLVGKLEEAALNMP